MRTPSRFRAETKYVETTKKKANVNLPMMAAVGNGDAVTFRVVGRDNFYWIRLINDANRLTQCFSPMVALAYDDYIYVAKAGDRKLTYYEFVSFIQAVGGETSPILNARGLIIPDNEAQGFYIEDDDSVGAGTPEYLRIVTTDGGQAVEFNFNNDDVNLIVNASALAGAFDLDGATGAITLAGPSMQVPDDWWIGLGAAAGRLVFDSTPAPDQIVVNTADVNLNSNDLIFGNTDTDTYLHEVADDQVEFVLATAAGQLDININAADDFTFTANSLNVLAGSAVTMADDTWVGLGGAAGRIVFDSTPAPDQVVMTAADLNMAGNDIIIPDAQADAMHIIDDTTAIEFQRFVTTAAAQATVFNNGEADVDFRIAASGVTNAFFVQGSDGFVGLGTGAPSEMLHLLSAVSTEPVLLLENTNADALAHVLEFYKNSAGPADNDDLGAIDFYGETSTGAKERYAYILGESQDVTNGDTGGSLRFQVVMDATERNLLEVSGYNGVVNQGEVIVNEDGQDVDFRIEAVGFANALFVEGSTSFVGFGTGAPDRLTHAEVVDAVTNAITYAQRLSHTVSAGAPAALYGTGLEMELEDAANNMQVAGELVTLWAVPTNGSEMPLCRWTTYPAGTAGPGYGGFVTANDVGAAAQTIIPNGTGDVTCVLSVLYAVCVSDGNTAGGSTTVDNNASVTLYNVGGNTLALAVAADGSVTLQRTADAGAGLTYDVGLLMSWI